jgi:Ca2+-binding EF-hand superfamily protein
VRCGAVRCAALRCGAQAFKFLEVDKDGSVAYDEFLTMLRQLDVGLTDEQIYELMRSADTDHDAQVQPIGGY